MPTRSIRRARAARSRRATRSCVGASADGEVVLHLGNHLGAFDADGSKAAVLVELGTECLGVHTGEASGEEGSNVLGFARYRNGSDAPSHADRAGAAAQHQAGGDRRGAGRVRGSRLHGGGLRRPGRAHRRSPGAAEIQRGAALPRRRARHGQGHGRDLPARPRLSRRPDRAGRARRARPPLRRRRRRCSRCTARRPTRRRAAPWWPSSAQRRT